MIIESLIIDYFLKSVS